MKLFVTKSNGTLSPKTLYNIKTMRMIIFFTFTLSFFTSFGQIRYGKYGLVKTVKVNWYIVDIIDNLTTEVYVDSIYYTVYELNKPDDYNIIFKENGDFLYNNTPMGTWKSTDNGVIYTPDVKKRDINRYENMFDSAQYKYSGDTLVLRFKNNVNYYYPVEKNNSKFHFDTRKENIRTKNWGIVAGTNYSKSLMYEFGISRSKLEVDSFFYSGDLLFELNPNENIYGISFSTYMYSKTKTWFPLILGASAFSYFQKNNLNFGMRQLIGVSGSQFGWFMSHFQLVYGYNILFNNEKINNLNRHYFSLKVNIPVIKLREKQFTFDQKVDPWKGGAIEFDKY